MIKDPKHNVEVAAEPELAMATRVARISGDSCLPVKQLSRKARTALWRTKASATGILKSTLAWLFAPPRSPTTRVPMSRRAVSCGPVTAQ